MTGMDRSTLYTFENIFGPIILAQDRIPSHSLEVWCSEDFMSEIGPPGEEPENLPAPADMIDMWDLRPAEDGGQKWLRMRRASLCKTGNVVASIRVNPPGSTDFIRFCPQHLSRFLAGHELSLDLTSPVRQYPDRIHLDMIRDSSMCGALIHELSHSTLLLDRMFTLDIKGETNGYYWREVIHHAQNNPVLAIKNADNFQYFVLAMFLNRNHWGTGQSEAMFGSGPARASPP
ncbi:hypothetical protein FQN49_005268 [Arthroderma sp. PD_2]|nr:hypothetical protein FQN49_005268 [Arthroderma sp. PD_2]